MSTYNFNKINSLTSGSPSGSDKYNSYTGVYGTYSKYLVSIPTVYQTSEDNSGLSITIKPNSYRYTYGYSIPTNYGGYFNSTPPFERRNTPENTNYTLTTEEITVPIYYEQFYSYSFPWTYNTSITYTVLGHLLVYTEPDESGTPIYYAVDAYDVSRGTVIIPIDTDGDGVLDHDDAFPNDSSESVDTDGDGVGDNADQFQEDPYETTDSDGDGVGDIGDPWPDDPNKFELSNIEIGNHTVAGDLIEIPLEDKMPFGSYRMRFAYIPPGSFTMGKEGDGTSFYSSIYGFPVNMTHGYYLGTTPITLAQYTAGNGNVYVGTNYNLSATATFSQTQSFIAQLNNNYGHLLPDGWRFALPTEAEWEHAYKAGTGGDNYLGRPLESTDGPDYETGNYPVGTYPPSPWGLYDMIGRKYFMQDKYLAYQYHQTEYDPNLGLSSPRLDPPQSFDNPLFLVNQVGGRRVMKWAFIGGYTNSDGFNRYSFEPTYSLPFRLAIVKNGVRNHIYDSDGDLVIDIQDPDYVEIGVDTEALEKATAFEQLKALDRDPISSLTGDLPSEKLSVVIDTDFSLLSERIYGPHKPSEVSVVNRSALIPDKPVSIGVGTDPYPTSSIDVISSPRNVKSLEVELSPHSVSSVTVYVYDPNVEDTDSDSVVDANDYFWRSNSYSLTKSELDLYVQKYNPLGAKSRVCRPGELVRWVGSSTTLSGHTYTSGEYYRVNTVNSNLYNPPGYTITLISKDEESLSYQFTPLNDEGSKFIRIISPDQDSDGDGIADVSDYFSTNVNVSVTLESLESWLTDTSTAVSNGDVIKYVGNSIYPSSMYGGTYDDSIIKNEYYIVDYLSTRADGATVLNLTNRFGDSPNAINMKIELSQRNRSFYKKTPPTSGG